MTNLEDDDEAQRERERRELLQELRQRAYADDDVRDDEVKRAIERLAALADALRGPAAVAPAERAPVPKHGHPNVEDVEPATAAPGTPVMLRGDNLDRVQYVEIGGIPASPILFVDRRRLEVVVPIGASKGEVRYSDQPAEEIELTIVDDADYTAQAKGG